MYICFREPIEFEASGITLKATSLQLLKKVWSIIKGSFDKVLVEMLKSYKSQSKFPSCWWRCNKSIASLFLPVEETDAVLETQIDDWSPISPSVRKVHGSSAIGKFLMAKALRQVELAQIPHFIKGSIQEFRNTTRVIDIALLNEFRRSSTAKIREVGLMAIDAYDKLRKVDVRYREVSSPLAVSTPLDEYNMHIESFIRGMAVEIGAVDPMWCENSFIIKGDKVPMTSFEGTRKEVFDLAVYEASKNFREASIDMLTDDEVMADTIADLIKRKSKFL